MKGPGTKVKATKFQHKGRVRATKEKHRGTSGHWYLQNVENHHEYTSNILELNIMNLKYLFINYKLQVVWDTRWWLEFTVPMGIKQIPSLPFTHISFRVKFEDERPVQQAARMLGLEVEAQNPLVLIQ